MGGLANTLNPNSVVDEFQSQAELSLQQYEALDQLVTAGGAAANILTLRRGLAADTVFRLGTQWEVFQHRWHVAAISKRPTVYRDLIQEQLTKGIEKAAIGHIIDAVTPDAASLPARLTVSQIEALVDSEGYNVSFKDCETWMAKSVKHLHADYASKVEAVVTNPEASSLVELLKAVRNVLAHSSTGSLRRFNACARKRAATGSVGLVGAANDGLVRDGHQVRDVPTYVQAWVHATQMRRIRLLHQRIWMVAEELRM
jgi:hypothetical protein